MKHHLTETHEHNFENPQYCLKSTQYLYNCGDGELHMTSGTLSHVG